MKVRTLADASRFVRRAGFAYVFPDNKVPLPSLWGAVTGDPARGMDPDDWGWTKAVERAWDLKDELGARRKAWFGRFFRGKGSLISLEMLPPLHRLVGGDEEGLLPEARELLERLRNVGPLSTYRLRMSLRLSGAKGNARFSKIAVQLYRRLLIANVGTDETETRWPSAVIGTFDASYPSVRRAAAKLSEEEALERVASKAPAMKPRALAALFGLPRLAACATIPRA
jgi:hypothetical protein